MAPLTPIHIAAIHHALVLLILKSETRIKELIASGNGKTEIAEYWRTQLAGAHQTLEVLGLDQG